MYLSPQKSYYILFINTFYLSHVVIFVISLSFKMLIIQKGFGI